MTSGPIPTPLADRLEASVLISDSGCWLWQKVKNRSGYGQIWTGSRTDGSRKLQLAHRVSYEVYVGPIPDEKVLDHLCRVPACINPEHLEPVTNNENLGRGRSANTHRTQRTRKPKKRHTLPFGEGSFYYRQRDARWVGTMEAGWTAKGSRRRIVVSDRDEDRAWDRLQAKRKVLLSEGRAAALQKSSTVGAWLAKWLTIQEASLRPNSYNGSASYVRKWIVPTIGRRPLDELTAGDVRSVARAVIDAGRSSTTAGTIQGVLQKSLRDAVAEGYSVPEAALLVPKPSKDRSKRRLAIPIDQAITLVKTAGAMPDGSRWIAALLQGMRQAERLGLLWESVDFKKSIITVSWQLQELVKRADGTYRVPDGYEKVQVEGRWHLVRVKSDSSWREIPMIPMMEATLLEWQNASPVSPHGLVWPGAEGRLTVDVADRDDWRALQDAAKVWKAPATEKLPAVYYEGHSARHTTATLLLAARVDPEIIKAIMGHSDIVTTAGYQHVSHQMKMDALTAGATLLGLTAD